MPTSRVRAPGPPTVLPVAAGERPVALLREELAVEVLLDAVWRPAALLGWRHDDDGRCQVRVRLGWDGRPRVLWTPLPILRLPEPAAAAAPPAAAEAAPAPVAAPDPAGPAGGPARARDLPAAGGLRTLPPQIPLPRRTPSPPPPEERLRREPAVPDGFVLPPVLGRSWAHDAGTLRRLIAGLRRMG